MRPQRKPFIVEIKRTKPFCRKPAPVEANPRDAAMQGGTKTTVGLAIRREGRA